MLVINRFRVDGPTHLGAPAQLEDLAAIYRAAPGCEQVDLVQNLDEPELFALVSRWTNVGSYRRALFGAPAQQAFVQLLTAMVDEPSAYLAPEELGTNIPRGS